jgi:type II secretory pathway component PulF
LGLAVVLIVSAQCLRSARRRRAALLLSYVEQSVRLNLPLPQMLEASAKSETPPVARRLRLLRAAIEDGSPIGDALHVAAPETPPRVVEMSDAAERNGRLRETLGRLLRNERPLGRRNPAGAAFARAYAAVLVSVMGLVLMALMVFVMPKFEQILKDFREPMPPVTAGMIGASRVLAVPLGAVALLAFLWMCGRAARDVLVARPLPAAAKGLLDRVIWYLPIAGRIARDRGLADAFYLIADAVEIGRPLDQAILEADRPHVSALLRERLARWSDALAAGMPPDAAARAAGMPRLVHGLLATAQPSGFTADVFNFLARYYESRFSRAALLVQNAVLPAIAICAGAVVCATALAVFIPMLRMLDHVSNIPRFTP